MAADWVKGRIEVDAKHQDSFSRYLPIFNGILLGVRDVDPMLMTLPDAKAQELLRTLGLSGPITYLSWKKQELIAKKEELESLQRGGTLSAQDRSTTAQLIEEATRYKLIRDNSVSAASLGLIRGISIVDQVLTVKFTPTTEKCLHRAALKAAMIEATSELALRVKDVFDLKTAKVEEILGVWHESDMDPALRAAKGLAISNNARRLTALTVGGATPASASPVRA